MIKKSILICLIAALCSCKNEPKTSAIHIPKSGYISYSTYKETKAKQDAEKAPSFSLKIPSHWKKQANNEMSLLSYTITRKKESAEFTVVKLGRMSGSTLDNVNRWRRQIKLSPLNESRLKKVITTLPTKAGQFEIVDIQRKQVRNTHNPRILAAILRTDSSTYFFKIMGDNALIEHEKKAFFGILELVQVP